MKRRFFTSLSMFTDYEPADVPGFTDMMSNAVFLADLAPLENSGKLAAGSLDLKYLSSLLHEGTHHATFDSTVGCALASLFSSCFSLWTLAIGQEAPTMPARDLIVLRTTCLLLQPIIEGMALFAEHDLVTGPSPVMSRPTQHASPLFTKGRIRELLDFSNAATAELLRSAKPEQLFSVAHTALLENYRHSEAALERKLLLLSQALDGPCRYLLGYLAVKGMYRILSQRCPPLKDPEVFLLVLIRHFFHDEELARIILRFYKTSEDPADIYLEIGQDLKDVLDRFQDLTDELYRNTAEASKAAIVPLFTDSGQRSLYGENGKEGGAGSTLPEDLSFLATIRTVGMINIAWPHLLKHRSDFRFSFEPVEVTVSDDRTIIIRHTDTGREYCLMTRCVENSARGTFPGSIEALRLRDFRIVVCILADEGLVAVLDCETGNWNSPDLCRHLDDLPSAIGAEGAMHAFYEWQQKQADKDSVRELLADYEGQSNEAVTQLYPQLLLYRTHADERNRIMGALANGIGALFADHASRKRIAKISLLTGCGATVASVASSLGISTEAFRSEVASFNDISKRECGIDFFQLTSSEIYSMI
ncbi:MAG: hypothetical protein ACR2IV_24165 [Bryobacteraceae bacterium]